MRVRVTIGTTYADCPSESFYIECDGEEDFVYNDVYSTEILNAISSRETPHFFINYDYEEEDNDDDYYDDDYDDEEDNNDDYE